MQFTEIWEHKIVNLETGCWEWTKAKDSNGYGVITFQQVNFRVHRIAALLSLRIPINDPRYILHKCDNSSCFNPDHLEAGDQLKNMGDASARKRIRNMQKTHCLRGHPLSGENLVNVMGANGRPGRQCRTCMRARISAFMRKKRARLSAKSSS